ncbi:MAG: homocysteine S-methyltransferase family protein, partial [Pseudomonadota bacterium]
MSDILLLDGGMGQELIARSSQPPSPLWSAKVLFDEPQIVEDVHRAYVDAG